MTITSSVVESESLEVTSRNRFSRLWRTGSKARDGEPGANQCGVEGGRTFRAESCPEPRRAPRAGPRRSAGPGAQSRSLGAAPRHARGSSTPTISSWRVLPSASSAIAPCMRILPRSTIAAWSQIFSTSSSRCEEMKTVRPSCSTIARIISRNSWMPPGSSPLVGSSRIRSRGSASRQRATPRRWRIPREYFLTFSSARSDSPTRRRAGTDALVRLGAARGGDDAQVLATGQLRVKAGLLDDRAHSRQGLGALGGDGSDRARSWCPRLRGSGPATCGSSWSCRLRWVRGSRRRDRGAPVDRRCRSRRAEPKRLVRPTVSIAVAAHRRVLRSRRACGGSTLAGMEPAPVLRGRCASSGRHVRGAPCQANIKLG